jgi:hypothetical protein
MEYNEYKYKQLYLVERPGREIGTPVSCTGRKVFKSWIYTVYTDLGFS